jgi:hypothetical protein
VVDSPAREVPQVDSAAVRDENAVEVSTYDCERAKRVPLIESHADSIVTRIHDD